MLIVAVVACAFFARKSKKPIATDVVLLLLGLLPPIVGNLLIIVSGNELVSYIGYVIYFIGLDIAVIALLRFICDYCFIKYRGTLRQKLVLAIVAIDVVQILLNPITGFTFGIVQTTVEGAPYYSLVPYAGQVFHRVVAYGIFFASVGVILRKVFTSSSIDLERYLVIALSMVFCGVWETYYIFSGLPIDLSMIGFGVFGLLVFYFSLHYRPFRLLDSMLARIVSDMSEAVVFLDKDGRCIYANAAAFKLLGIEEDALDEAYVKAALLAGFDVNSYNEEWSFQRAVMMEGQARHWDLQMRKIEDKRGQRAGSFLVIRDRTDEEILRQEELYQASHDSLTGLNDKDNLYRLARNLIDSNPDVVYQVVALDVKDFKIVNDIFSKEFGDKVLCEIASWICAMAPEGSVHGRISGDKFGAVTPIGSIDEEALEEKLRHFNVTDGTVSHNVVLHVGCYEVSERDLPISVMFDRAFMAISTVKKDYQKHIAHYDDKMRESMLWKQSISAQLEDAIKNNQICPYLQPMVDESGKVSGAEVLVRWIHPEEGFLSPASFIPVFEENGMIARLDSFIWTRACEILSDWQKRGIDMFLSVNISPKDFYFIDVYEVISSLVAEHGIDPSKLRLEITETVMMSDVENRLRIIEELRSKGFLVEMDDFGSGYSSLNMLKDIPVDILKIDMMFLYKTKDQYRAQTILQNIINLSGDLGMPAVTEGVETADQLDMLVNMGCRMFQGYYFAKPMPLEEFEDRYHKAA